MTFFVLNNPVGGVIVYDPPAYKNGEYVLVTLGKEIDPYFDTSDSLIVNGYRYMVEGITPANDGNLLLHVKRMSLDKDRRSSKEIIERLLESLEW